MTAHTIRRFRPDDAAPTRAVFHAAVRIGAAGHYPEADLIDWSPSPDPSPEWGPWLHSHFTVVSEDGARVTGFFMMEADGYLNMAFVLPECRGTGLADRLYQAILAEARARGLTRMTVVASRLARPFFARRGWQLDPAYVPRPGIPILSADGGPLNWGMVLDPVTP